MIIKGEGKKGKNQSRKDRKRLRRGQATLEVFSSFQNENKNLVTVEGECKTWMARGQGRQDELSRVVAGVEVKK